ncbi:MAG: valine--tRNA ligase [Candidatus Levybacteria bacterium]|nr:valine--tRNA ligase [Candidatus Levybacteria bacterium]
MDKIYNYKNKEKEIYKNWEEKEYFKPTIDPKKKSFNKAQGKPFTIALPPPNASGKMHTGNVLMIAIEDLLIRWHRMKGDPTLWVPGTDHAGTETQITFEKALQKQGKSRFSFSRHELYDAIWKFVAENKGQIESQIRQMGASVDWSRYTFTLDAHVIKTVHETFKKMVEDGLVYRSNYMVNYCPKCGTTYADVELKHGERHDPLYYVKYERVVKEKGHQYISVATARPEPIAEDTHLAVNPKDKKHKELIGQKVLNPLTGKEMEIIGDEFVDPEFGTGIVKLSPAIDKNDYEVALKHKLPINEILELSGKMTGRYRGMSVLDARKKAVEELEHNEKIEKVDEKYVHTVTLCKAGHSIEPMIMPNWFIKVDEPNKSLKKPALDAVKNGDIKIYPKWREITYIRWMEEMRDWPVSRQNVWGIQIPIWYQVDGHEGRIAVSFIDRQKRQHNGPLRQWLDEGFSFEEIEEGLQQIIVPQYEAVGNNPKWIVSQEKPKDGRWIQETDTFDTWFSSGQWPLVTLKYPDSEDFKYFYPTSVMETGWEIIRLWVSRMIMFGYYLTGEKPFENVYLHGIVRALDGRKMSKSLGNVINPEEYIEQYGVDALRMGLISGTANGKDFNFPKDKVIAYKHFANKIWNMGRFILLMIDQLEKDMPAFETLDKTSLHAEDTDIVRELEALVKTVDTELEKFRFADAGEAIYHFMWHTLADKYIESVKQREDKDIALSVLMHVYVTCLKLLHPFMPFITEEIYQKLGYKDADSIMIAKWPTAQYKR